MAAPLTQFEIDGTVTSLATEAAFLAQVAADTSATLTVAGESAQGRTMHRLDLGNPAGTTWMLMTLVHANEPASREAILAFVRDLAYSTDPVIVDYLAAHRIVLLTPQNPDGLANGTRNSTLGDVNKDHLSFATPEAQVVQTVLRATDPHLVLDAHERFGSTSVDLEYYGIGTLAVHEALRDAADAVCAAVATAAQAQGYTTAPYPYPGRVSGRENAALHHAASVLLETFAYDPLAHRIEIYADALEAIREWHSGNAQALIDAKAASKAAGLANEPSPYILQTGDTAFAAAWPQITLPDYLVGYRVIDPLPTEAMTAYGVVAHGDLVTMSQEARVVVPLLFDPESEDRLAAATRVITHPPDRPLPTTPLSAYMIKVGGVLRPLIQHQRLIGGVTHTLPVT